MKANKKSVPALTSLLLAASLFAFSCAGNREYIWEDDPELTPPDTPPAASTGSRARAAPASGPEGVEAAVQRSASGVYELSEDFESFAEGTAFSRGSLPGSVFAVSSNPAGGGSAEIIIVADGPSKALKMTHTGPVTGGQTRFFYKPAQELVDAVGLENKVEIAFSFKVEGTNGTVSLPYIYYTTAPSSAGLTANYNAGNGVFAAWDGSRQVPNNSLAKGEWHSFRAVLDYAESVFDLFVDDQAHVNIAAFRQNANNDPEAPKDFGEIRFYLANVADGASLTLYLDDLKIRAGF
jgi:hypothetical protein